MISGGAVAGTEVNTTRERGAHVTGSRGWELGLSLQQPETCTGATSAHTSPRSALSKLKELRCDPG